MTSEVVLRARPSNARLCALESQRGNYVFSFCCETDISNNLRIHKCISNSSVCNPLEIILNDQVCFLLLETIFYSSNYGVGEWVRGSERSSHFLWLKHEVTLKVKVRAAESVMTKQDWQRSVNSPIRCPQTTKVNDDWGIQGWKLTHKMPTDNKS